MKKIVLIIAVFFLSTLAFSAQTTKSLKLPAEGITKLSVDAGAGSLEILGVEGLSTIEVEAVINVDPLKESRFEDFLKDHLRFSLEKHNGEAVLKGFFEFEGFVLPRNASVDLKVRLPKAMNLYVDDGSGWATVEGIRGDVEIDDGSGDLTVVDIEGNLTIDDGSGDIDIRNVTGDVRVDDGSGSMDIVKVGGSVTVDDGSGSIFIDDVGKDVILDSTGSGSVRTDRVRGRVVR